MSIRFKAAALPFIVAGVLAGVPSAHGQAPSSPSRPRSDPADANVSVPAVDYRSAFAQYERRGAVTPIPWKTANDEVARIGGWRTYAKEASRADPATEQAAPVPASPDANTPVKPAEGGHAGHRMK